ncbi:MAG: TetR/AcrR family transcriptional regulator [Alphaproteobacteria bacterium]|nr:TetR/AcrR family transcriptional regulator [Alphaproteobacteria bacterium]
MNAPDMRTQLLTAATRRFARQGYAGTSLQAIADDVGVAKPSIVYWFPTKAALREAVLDSTLDRWQKELPALLTAATTGPDRFTGGLAAVVSFFQEDPDRARLLTRECLDRPEAMRERLRAHLNPWMGVVTTFIRMGQAEGRVRPDLDPEAWVLHLVLLVLSSFALGPVAEVTLPPGKQDLEQRRLAELLRVARASLYLDAGTPR